MPALGSSAESASVASASVSAEPTLAKQTLASAESGRPTLLVAFIFTKIGKVPAGFELKQADMQVYMDRAADKLGRILDERAPRTGGRGQDEAR